MTPNLSALSAAFAKFGGKILKKEVNELDLSSPAITVMKNIRQPEVLPKIAALGGPRPYRTNDDSGSNGVAFIDRTLTVYQSKWDFEYDPEAYRNTYLALEDNKKPYYEFALEQIAEEYMAAINDETIGEGERNASGTAAADIADGFLTIIADEITATNLTPVVTGAITNENAVDKVRLLAKALPNYMRKKGAVIVCSYDVFDKYAEHYNATNNFRFNPDADGEYSIDGFSKIKLKAESWMNDSQRLIACRKKPLVVGTDGDRIQVAATARMNILEVRVMMPIGCQIADLAGILVNDQA